MSSDSKFTRIDTSKLLKNSKFTRPLKIDRIKTLDDVKRILEFLNIEVTIDDYSQPNGYENVRNLFE